MYTWMGSTPWFVEIVNVAVPFGQVAIGLGLIVGLLTRLAAFFGALVMFLFYFGNRSVEHGPINGASRTSSPSSPSRRSTWAVSSASTP
jgi:thiosulfate dehydrogenase [quinone] large subunit